MQHDRTSTRSRAAPLKAIRAKFPDTAGEGIKADVLRAFARYEVAIARMCGVSVIAGICVVSTITDARIVVRLNG